MSTAGQTQHRQVIRVARVRKSEVFICATFKQVTSVSPPTLAVEDQDRLKLLDFLHEYLLFRFCFVARQSDTDYHPDGTAVLFDGTAL